VQLCQKSEAFAGSARFWVLQIAIQWQLTSPDALGSQCLAGWCVYITWFVGQMMSESSDIIGKGANGWVSLGVQCAFLYLLVATHAKKYTTYWPVKDLLLCDAHSSLEYWILDLYIFIYKRNAGKHCCNEFYR